MPSYTLKYFNAQGRTEPLRFILNYAGIDFTDERFDKSDWPTIKPSMPYGQVPVLQIDGNQYNQSIALCRYFAKKCGLAGKDEWEDYEIDATVYNIHDIRTKIIAPIHETNPEIKEQKFAAAKEAIPFFIERLDAQVGRNGGYFVGGKLTWADLVFVAFIDNMNFHAKQDIIEKAENLKALREKVLALPRIKAWVEKRPVTDQ